MSNALEAETAWTVTTTEARRELRPLLNSVEHEKAHVTIMRYETPAAVIVPIGWYEAAKAAIGDDI